VIDGLIGAPCGNERGPVARRLGREQRHQRRDLLAETGAAEQALHAAHRDGRVEAADVELDDDARAGVRARVRHDRAAREEAVRRAVHRQVLGDLVRDPALHALQVGFGRRDQARRAVALGDEPAAVVRAAVDLAVVRQPPQPRHRGVERLRERVDVGQRGERVLLPPALGVLGVEAIDVGGVVPEHARPEVHDVRALVRVPRLPVELAANAPLLDAPRLVELPLGVGHARRAARIGEARARDLGVDPLADAALGRDVGPLQRGLSHASPRA
jgi:hypothetical protein